MNNKNAIEILKKCIVNDRINFELVVESKKAILFFSDEVTALLVDLKLSKHKYELRRNLLKDRNEDILALYK